MPAKGHPRTAGGLAMLVLVSLAFMQLATATHQFDHPANVAFDACGICLQLDRCDDLLPAAAAPTVDCSPIAVAAVAFADVIPAIAALPVRQRGPPHA